MLKVTCKLWHELITPADWLVHLLDRADPPRRGHAAASAPEREYTLQGQVLSVAADRKEATIKHEEIKGFMAAMTMPYKVRDTKELDGLAPGDLITASWSSSATTRI